MPQPDVSIVVPTHDRPGPLAGCLAALERQESCGEFEIIVVDDGSREEALVAAIVAQAPHARLIRLDGSGPAAARNAGARAARAPILCFTDDDCEPRPTWATRLAGTLKSGADAVGGGIVDIRPCNPYLLALRSMGRTMRELTDERYIGSLNMGCRAEVFAVVPFDERYPFASEDRDWSVRLRANGYRLARNIEAVVMHTREDDLGEWIRRYARYGEGSYLYRKTHSGGRPEAANVYTAMLRAGFSYGPRVGALVLLSQLATAVGFARAARADRWRQHPISPKPRYDEDEV